MMDITLYAVDLHGDGQWTHGNVSLYNTIRELFWAQEAVIVEAGFPMYPWDAMRKAFPRIRIGRLSAEIEEINPDVCLTIPSHF